MTAKEFVEEYTKQVVTNKCHTFSDDFYLDTRVNRLSKKCAARGDKWFFPHKTANGEIINMPEIQYHLKFTWSPEGYEEFLKSLDDE